MKAGLISMEKIHGDAGRRENRNHHAENAKIAEKFAEAIIRFAHRASGENLSYAYFAIAIDGIFHDVESGEGQKNGREIAHKAADVGGVVGSLVFSEAQENLPGSGQIAEVKRESECDEETVTADALEKIGASQMIQNARSAGSSRHAAGPFTVTAAVAARCAKRDARYASSRVGAAFTALGAGCAVAITRTWTPSERRAMDVTENSWRVAVKSALGTVHSQTLSCTERSKSSGDACATKLPFATMAMSVATASTSETMCVERITMRSPASSESKLRKRTRSSGSSPAVGSSAMSSCGSFKSACAMPMRCFMPPEKPPSGRLRASPRFTSTSSSSILRREDFASRPLTAARYSRNSTAVKCG